MLSNLPPSREHDARISYIRGGVTDPRITTLSGEGKVRAVFIEAFLSFGNV